MRASKLLLFIMPFFIVACSNKKENTSLRNEVVLIVYNPTKQVRFTYPSGMMSVRPDPFLIAYVDEDAMTYYLPEDGLDIDTLTLRCVQEYKEILLSYRSKEEYSILAQKGDTILVTFNSDGYPMLESRTSKSLTDAYNFTLSIKDSKVFLGLEALSHIGNSCRLEEKFGLPMAPASLKEKYKNDYLPSDSLNKLFSIYIQNYQGGLESLSNNENLSSNFVHFYSYILQLKRWQAYLNRFFFNTKLTTDTTINNFFNDSFYPYPSYRNFANLYVTTYVSKHFNIPFIRESNGSYMDSRISFDTIASQEDIPTQTKVLLLRNCLSWIINNFSANDLKIYLDKYEAITGDTHTVQRLKQKHKLDFSTSNELMLQDGNGHPLSFQDLLEKHKNKVIYVDFWASWCAPCQRAMPDAKKLREEYKDKAIVFVYLAFNDEEKAWKNAVKKFEVDCLSESYFITNSKTSQLIVDLEVKSIPRYLLYNKLGKLVHKKAPDVKGEEIRTLLNQYLAE